MSRDAALIARLIKQVEETGNRRARRWVKALTRDKRNPAKARHNGQMALPAEDLVATLLDKPWLNWPTPERLRRRT